MVNKKVVPIKIDGKIVGSATVDLDNLEGPISGNFTDSEAAKKYLGSSVRDLSIYVLDPADAGLYGETIDGQVL